MSTQSKSRSALILTNVISICLTICITFFATRHFLYKKENLRSQILAQYQLDPSCGLCPQSFCTGNCYPPKCDLIPPLPLEYANLLVSNYRCNHWRSINSFCPTMKNRGDTVDSRTAWFNLDSIKDFINAVETQTCYENQNNNSFKLGIRIYFGEYPKDTSYLFTHGVPSEYSGFHTLVLIPTYYDNVLKQNVDFEPRKPIVIGAPINFDSTGLVGVTGLIPSLDITAENHAGLAPPPGICDQYWNNTGALFMSYVDHADGYGQPPGVNNPKPHCPESTLTP